MRGWLIGSTVLMALACGGGEVPAEVRIDGGTAPPSGDVSDLAGRWVDVGKLPDGTWASTVMGSGQCAGGDLGVTIDPVESMFMVAGAENFQIHWASVTRDASSITFTGEGDPSTFTLRTTDDPRRLELPLPGDPHTIAREGTYPTHYTYCGVGAPGLDTLGGQWSWLDDAALCTRPGRMTVGEQGATFEISGTTYHATESRFDLGEVFTTVVATSEGAELTLDIDNDDDRILTVTHPGGKQRFIRITEIGSTPACP